MFRFFHRSTSQAPNVIHPGEPTPTPRPAWRQAIIDEFNRRPGRVALPANTITSPGKAPIRFPHPRETANRAALARDLARFLFSNGSGIPYTDALRMGPSQWRLARQAVRTGRPVIPSHATIELTLDRLRELEAALVTRAQLGRSIGRASA